MCIRRTNKGSMRLNHLLMNAKETQYSYNECLKPLFDFVTEREDVVVHLDNARAI